MGWRAALPDTTLHRDCRARAKRRQWPILAGAGRRRRSRWRRSVAGQFLHLRRPRGPCLCRRLRPCRRRIAVPAISPPRAGLNPACYGHIRIGGSGVISRANSSIDARDSWASSLKSDWLRCPQTRFESASRQACKFATANGAAVALVNFQASMLLSALPNHFRVSRRRSTDEPTNGR